ncbi:protein of unknown function UPF0157 [Acidiphilium cryptum JF-5]|uniref:GrpB family protein n=2 Tax=Acidiphilium cryptum TaxID=524 RepID=A5G319_ACICJ|nr:protein of unknown function UPF0157 [Acidiphilium cryptum JF-5]
MDHVEMAEYDPAWPGMFETEARLLKRVLPPGFIVRMEHIGSTAVPGIAAKPVIDILAGVRDVEEARTIASPLLAPNGYTIWTGNPFTDRIMFIKGLPPAAVRRTHHLHMALLDGAMWDTLVFRDLLRADAAERVAYETLKRDLAIRFRDDRNGYTAAKSEHIQAAMQRARINVSR